MNPIEPDKHLQVALRHAPDANTKAPPELTAQILAAAHRSARERPSPLPEPAVEWRTRLMAWWRLPQAHAAMATVLLAGVVGLLWRDEQPGPGVDRDLMPVAQAPQTAAPPPPAAPAETAQAELRATHQTQRAGRPELDAQSRQQAARARHHERARAAATPDSAALKEPAAADPMRKADGLDKSSETAGAALPAPPVAPTAVPAAAATAATAAIPAPVTAPAPAPAPAPALAPAVQVSGAANQAKPTPTSSPAAAVPSPAAPAARMLGTQAQQPNLTRLTPPPLALDTSAVDGWTWQPGSALRQPDRAWMSALLQPAQGQWRPVGDAQPVKSSLRLERSPPGEPAQQIWLEPESLLWCVANRGCQRAPMAAQQRQTLLEGLTR